MSSNRPDLLPQTLDEAEARVIEEIGEALQAYGKMKRFGERAVDPVTDIPYDNRKDFNQELVDVLDAIKRYGELWNACNIS